MTLPVRDEYDWRRRCPVHERVDDISNDCDMHQHTDQINIATADVQSCGVSWTDRVCV